MLFNCGVKQVRFCETMSYYETRLPVLEGLYSHEGSLSESTNAYEYVVLANSINACS